MEKFCIVISHKMEIKINDDRFTIEDIFTRRYLLTRASLNELFKNKIEFEIQTMSFWSNVIWKRLLLTYIFFLKIGKMVWFSRWIHPFGTKWFLDDKQGNVMIQNRKSEENTNSEYIETFYPNWRPTTSGIPIHYTCHVIYIYFLCIKWFCMCVWK